MHPRAKSETAKQLVKVATETTTETNLAERFVAFNGPHGYFAIAGPHLAAFEDVRDKLLKSYEQTLSERYITKRLFNTIGVLRAAADIGRAEELLDSLLADFQQAVREYLVYVPLVGIRLDVEQVELGNVVILTLTEPLVNKLLGSARTSLPSVDDVVNGTVARYSCLAEKTRALLTVAWLLDSFQLAA